MVVPIGFGVGDFVAVGTLAWNVYKSCKAAPGSFSNISNEVLSLHAVLKEADETIFKSPLLPESRARLKTIGDGCQDVLGDLQALVDRYEKWGTQSKRTWDRMKWGAEDIVEIRSRLISNATMLTAFISTSQTSVEQKLDKLISDFQQGKRAPSVVSLQTVDSLDPDDKEAWRTIRKELEDIGISIAAFEANKDFIFEWLSNAVDTGAFQEQAVSSPSGSVHSLDVLSSTSSLSSSGVEESNKETVMSGTEPYKASKAKTKLTGNYTITQAEQQSNGSGAAAESHAPVIPTKFTRLETLFATLSRPKKRLHDAVVVNDLDRIKKILTYPATSRLIDKPTLNKALHRAIKVTSKEACALLIEAGADVNDCRYEHPPLIEAVLGEDRDLVAFLLDVGADVNYQRGDGTPRSSALRAAISRGDETMITLLSQRGAEINAVQKVYQLTTGYPTGLHQASAESSASVVDLLINLGADFKSSQIGFGTPLMFSILKLRFSIVKLFIQRGANINDLPSVGYPRIQFPSLIHVAIHVSSPDLVQLLLENGVVTDWYEAYEFADYWRRREDILPPTRDDRPLSEIISAAREVQELIKEQISAGQGMTPYTSQ